MPKELHDALAKRAARMGLIGDRKNAYIYGTLDKVEKKHVKQKRKNKRNP